MSLPPALLLAWPMLGERPSWRQFLALVFAVGGVALLVGVGSAEAQGGDRWRQLPGVAMGLCAAVLFGPHVWNFKEPAARLQEHGAALQVADAAALERDVGRLLVDAEWRRQMGALARRFVQAQQGATEKTLTLLDQLVGLSTAKSRPLPAPSAKIRSWIS